MAIILLLDLPISAPSYIGISYNNCNIIKLTAISEASLK
jgi:hypothetical protein